MPTLALPAHAIHSGAQGVDIFQLKTVIFMHGFWGFPANFPRRSDTHLSSLGHAFSRPRLIFQSIWTSTGLKPTNFFP
jgi:hypothetical protein